MTIHYRYAGATIRAQAAALVAEHQAIVRDVPAAGGFGAGSASVASKELITQLGDSFQVIYGQANGRRRKVRTTASNWPNVMVLDPSRG
jgi:hypothetical protein